MARRLSGFGRGLKMLMLDRGYERQVDLLLALRDEGFEATAQNLSVWLHGTRPPPEFIQAVVRLLDLTEKEELALYRSYVWESRES